MLIVHNAFNGRFADSPRAVHAALVASGRDLDQVWLQDPRFAPTFPAGVRTVPIGSPAAVQALEAADVVVNNTHVQLDRWSKSAHTFYLQTWHGTPLKRIHRSALSVPGEEVMTQLDEDIARWDLLLTQSPTATRLLRAAFDYAGPVLESGYPRNDLLSAPDAGERRRSLRVALGVAEDQTAVLYAPTYRDDQVDDPDAPDGLDPRALLDRLGPGHVLLLRDHYYLFRRPAHAGGPNLVDVSGHPEVADLYLAADVLVTDYSSAMFDFAVTGKPILLYLYDLDRFRGELRGFALDPEAEAPGPVLRNQDELAEALVDLDGSRNAYAAAYAAFRARHCALEDGQASSRVVQALLTATGTR